LQRLEYRRYFLETGQMTVSLKTILAVAAVATLCGNAPAVWERTRVAIREYPRTLSNPFNCGNPDIDERRALVRESLPADEPLHLFESRRKGFSPHLRTLRIALAWEVMPQRVLPFSDGAVSGRIGYLATSVYEGKRPVADDTLISLKPEADGPVWARQDVLVQKPARHVCVPSPLRELAGLAAPLLVMLGGAVWGGWLGLGVCLLAFSVGMGIPPLLGFAPSPVFVLGLAFAVLGGLWTVWRRRRQRRGRGSAKVATASLPSDSNDNGGGDAAVAMGNDRDTVTLPVCLALGLFTLLAFLSLSHTFTSPNGLGVFGGKAKLLYLAGGIPAGFFTDDAWAVLQPAYPPGFALVTLGCYGFAKGCGEYLTQLLPCVFSALACLLICTRLSSPTVRQGGLRSAFCMLWMGAMFLGAQSLWTASLYYAEPLMLLLVLLGLDAVLRKPNPVLGWVLVGGAGWVKNEGLLFLPLLWVALRWAEGRARAPLQGLLLGLALPVGWLVWARFHGATLYDYAPMYLPDFRQAGMAAAETLRLAFFEPWRYGFAFPLACLALFFPALRTKRGLAGFVVLLGYTMATWWIFGISRAPDFEWHLQSLERLLWPPAMLSLFYMMPAGQGHRSDIEQFPYSAQHQL